MVTAIPEAASGPPLLVHSHPGHELRLFRWMEQHRPILFLMTDGSGGGETRTRHSEQCVLRAGASVGAAFGLAADRDWYAAVLNADLTLFDKVIDAVVHAAIEQRSKLIVSDAVDGYNPMHDLCEAVACAAAQRLRSRGHGITHLVARAVSGGESDDVVAEILLDRDAQCRKQAAVDAYTPLAEEVQRLLEEDSAALIRERLRRPTFTWPANWSPSWERIGVSRVAASKYTQRIEYTPHVRPLALALLGDQAPATIFNSGERAGCVS
jgi:hypothetical protein